MHSFAQWNCSSLRVIPALTAVAAIAAGCCPSRTTKTASYSRPPAYAGGAYEEPAPAPAPTVQGQNNMVVPLYQESVNVGKREVEAGAVRLKKIVRTETVNVPVELRHEEVVIDRDNNARGDQNKALGQPFQEQETTIQLKREEPVIEKQTTQAGQIVVQTRFAEEKRNIQAQVRREDIDIKKEGNAQNVIIGENVHARGAFGGGESVGGQASGAARSATVITDPAMFTSTTDEATLAGRPVRFHHAKVRRVIGDRLLVLGTDNNREIYIIPAQNTPMPAEGDTVVITGTVRKSPGSASELGLNGEAAQAFGSQPVYIEAEKVEISGK